jgi:hypothetical protein
MKILPSPDVPGSTDAQRMDNAVKTMFFVSRDELLRREAAWRESRPKKKTKKART